MYDFSFHYIKLETGSVAQFIVRSRIVWFILFVHSTIEPEDIEMVKSFANSEKLTPVEM